MPKRPPLPHVSEHALLRYLERSLMLDLPRVKKQIARKVAAGVALGAKVVVVDGVRFVIRGNTVVTALPKNSVPLGHEDRDRP